MASWGVLRLFSIVTTGHSRTKDGVASLAYDPVSIVTYRRRGLVGNTRVFHGRMDCRVFRREDGASRLLPGNDEM